MKPLVSILIPAYNAQAWLGDTLRSAIAQTWDRKEIIIVDDGSTDQTLAVARQFESDQVKVFTKKNEGAAATRNTCLSLCSGDYIQWLDADDLLVPDKIARQLERVDREKLGKRTLLSSGWASFLYRYHHVEFAPTPLWADLSREDWLARKMGLNLHMQTATWLVSRELCDAAGPWNTKLLGDDDGEYFCRVLMASDGVKFVANEGVYYRQPGSSSLSFVGRSEKKMVAQWHSMELHIGYLRSLEDSERTRAACVRYIQTWLVYFYPERMDIVEKAQAMAKSLGGELVLPRLSWKYEWIRVLFGWKVARAAQIRLQNGKAAAVRWLDRTLFRVDQLRGAGKLGVKPL